MSYQTIVAAFDTAAHAQAAVEALKTGGFHSDDISVFDKNRVGMREPGLWSRMFGGGLAQHEADVYTQSLERGGVVLSVRVPDSEQRLGWWASAPRWRTSRPPVCKLCSTAIRSKSAA